MERLSEILSAGQQVKIEAEGRQLILTVSSIHPDFFTLRPGSSHDGADLRIGIPVKGVFLKEDQICTFESRLIKKEMAPAQYSVSWPRNFSLEKIRCYQRGGFTGVEGAIPIKYELMSKGLEEVKFTREGVAVWIGGDELTLASVEEIPRGTVMAIEIGSPVSPAPIQLFARVHKIKEHGDLFHIRLLFQAVGEKNRDTILRYCLQKQALLNRAGLLAGEDAG